MRNAFIEELVMRASTNDRIALVVGDLGFSVVEPFADRFPDRFINAGVAEQNMMGLAAGMASEGYHVFAYSIANFPTFRCAEQIRNDVDYHNLSVTVVSVGGGLAYGNLGYSHHAVQDYGLIRMLPNMLIAAPGDPMEVRACLRYLIENPQPSYLRLGKAGEPCFHNSVPDIKPGLWTPVSIQESSKNVILTTGAMLALAHDWIQSTNYADYSICSMPIWGMKSKSMQAEQLQKWDAVVTIEDHLEDCGFGSWIRESLASRTDLGHNLTTIALDPKICGIVGTQKQLNNLGGLVIKNVG